MTSTLTSASLASPPAIGSSGPGIRRVAVLLTSLVAGAVGCVIAYWTWRMVLRIPLGLEPELHLPAAATAPQPGDGAPWWVPSAIVGAVAMLLWPVLAAHARRISLIGGSAAIVLVSLLIFPVAAMCVEVTALTHNGWPSLVEFAGAVPHMAGEAVRITFLNLVYCGLVTVPAAALIGLLLAGMGRLIVWMVERVSGPHGSGDAD